MSKNLSKNEVRKITRKLLSKGWSVNGEFIYAPHKTMWLHREKMWTQNLRNFRNRMAGRFQRITELEKRYPRENHDSLDDARSLVETLDSLATDGGLESFFAKISDVLASFGKAHNLRLRKYYCGEEAWDFVFKHPRGGVGRIMIYRETRKTVFISRLWWVDDFAKLTRYHKKNSVHRLRLTKKALLPILEDSLRTITNWKKRELRFGVKLAKQARQELRLFREHYENYYPVPVIEI